MPKLKQRDALKQQDATHFQLASSSTGSGAEPAAEPERKRAKLSFSIESIMESVCGRFKSASPSEQSLSPLGAGKCELELEACERLSSESRSESGASSPSAGAHSRASTPISPGGSAADEPARLRPKGKLEPLEREAGGVSAAAAKRAGPTNQLLRPQECLDPRLAPFECQLDNLELWHRFHALETEMIITKQGRRMFPPVRVNFGLADSQPGAAQPALNPKDKYHVLMDILPYDHKRYRYAYHKSSWQQAGKADPPSQPRLFLHPDGPFSVDQLRRQVISFEKIKLTNNDANQHGYIVLNSMHKYQPRIHLLLCRGKQSQNLANAPVGALDAESCKTFVFSETIFTAVTAYQNHSITKLKIDSNPFAKGFRDSTRLTDLELESMQDLMTDGQCPFSPPRAPPHGFQHFLFPGAQQNMLLGGPEDPASALLRERTILALDSFLQQQQQGAIPQHRPAQVLSPQRPLVHQQHQHQQQHQQQARPQQHSGPLPTPTSCMSTISSQPAAFSQANLFAGQAPNGAHLDQLLLQQRQQFASAMLAASQHPLNSLFGVLPASNAHQSPADAAKVSPGCEQSPSGALGLQLSAGKLGPGSKLGAEPNGAELRDAHLGRAALEGVAGAATPLQYQLSASQLQVMVAAAQQQHKMAAMSLQLEQQQASLAAALARQQQHAEHQRAQQAQSAHSGQQSQQRRESISSLLAESKFDKKNL